jgi:hypothetical protein
MNSHDWEHAALIVGTLVLLHGLRKLEERVDRLSKQSTTTEPDAWTYRVYGQPVDWRRD